MAHGSLNSLYLFMPSSGFHDISLGIQKITIVNREYSRIAQGEVEIDKPINKQTRRVMLRTLADDHSESLSS